MSFVDETRIIVTSGNGGNGIVAFRREKYVPRGGPAGGDGGAGGSVVLRATAQETTLRALAMRRQFRAENGRSGGGKKRTGRSGADLTIEIPCGTLVRDADTDEILCDLVTPAQTFLVARGGRGGKGNAAFATATNQTPREATPGTPGRTRRLRLELKLIAQVGLVGLPNAGKSTFLRSVTRSRPAVGAYPFTTLRPCLGVADLGPEREELVLADIPGLIEGASEGAGLGHEFLRHVERTHLLLHLVDGAAPDFGGPPPEEAYRTIRGELAAAGRGLAEKAEIVALNKTDLLSEVVTAERRAALAAASGAEVHVISGATRDGVRPLLEALAQMIRDPGDGVEPSDRNAVFRAQSPSSSSSSALPQPPQA